MKNVYIELPAESVSKGDILMYNFWKSKVRPYRLSWYHKIPFLRKLFKRPKPIGISLTNTDKYNDRVMILMQGQCEMEVSSK